MFPRRLFRIRSSRSPFLLIAACTRLLWLFIILWGELGVFHYVLSDCKWPTTESNPNDAHILIVADPQVLDQTSYPGRAPWLMAITQNVVDFNLRKSWKAVRSKLKPNAVVFLGDMMDNGRRVRTEEKYKDYYSKFCSIFRHDDRMMPAYYLPGNHDVDLGLSSPPDLKFLARIRYGTYFGATNRLIIMHNATFVFLDAPGIVDEYMAIVHEPGKDWKKHATKGGALSFLLKVACERQPEGSLILLTHIPLYRPDSTGGDPCGPLREHRNLIYNRYGDGYQNLLPKAVSSFILEHVRPEVIFSGDDHDHCAYTHAWHADLSPTPEITISSFSMAMGIERPGFQLLTIANQTYATTACFLPSQVRIYTHLYLPLALFNLGLLIGAAFYENKLEATLPMQEPKWRGGGGGRANLREVSKTVGTVVAWYAVVWCWITGFG